MDLQSPRTDFRVLVVEDAEDLTLIWGALFRREGISARFCNSARAALAVLDGDFRPNVVMTDYYLPDLTGLELVTEVRKRSQEIRCLMVTGNRDDAFVASVEEHGVPLLFKPLRFADLLRKLDEIRTERPFVVPPGRPPLNAPSTRQ